MGGIITGTLFTIVSLLGASSLFVVYPERMVAYLKHMWVVLLFLLVAESFSFGFSVIILGVIAAIAVREYYSLVAIRPQDRWGVLGAFLSIPFMLIALYNAWYEPFIIFLMLYGFLLIPFLVVLGGKESDGTVFSIGAIDFGMFLFVSGSFHVGFMAFESSLAALLIILSVCLTDGVAFTLTSLMLPQFQGRILKYVVALPFTVLLAFGFMPTLCMGWGEAILYGILVPPMVGASRYVMVYVEEDLGIASDYETLRRGRLINSSCSLMMSGPVLFHYLRMVLS